MLVYINNQPQPWFKKSDPIVPLNIAGDVIICIDPSKTNMATLIGSPFGEVYSILEFSGNNRRSGPTMDTTVYCEEMRDYLTRYLENVKVLDACVEKSITRKGMEHHRSTMVLTEIRGCILNLFAEEYGIRGNDVEINNWTWKHSILPEGYRSQSEKGSKRFIEDKYPNSPFCYYFEADATDALCMYWHKIKKYVNNYKLVCNKEEKALNNFKVGIYPTFMDNAQGMRQFIYNNRFGIEQNAIYYSNRSSVPGIASLKLSDLSIEEIYKYACAFSNIEEKYEDARVVVTR